MPHVRLRDEYLEQDGVRFLMADETGNTVACRVSHEALRDHADRVHLSGTDSAIFEAYRELIEDVASKTFDAEGPFDDHGRILVTSEALARVTRSAWSVFRSECIISGGSEVVSAFAWGELLDGVSNGAPELWDCPRGGGA